MNAVKAGDNEKIQELALELRNTLNPTPLTINHNLLDPNGIQSGNLLGGMLNSSLSPYQWSETFYGNGLSTTSMASVLGGGSLISGNGEDMLINSMIGENFSPIDFSSFYSEQYNQQNAALPGCMMFPIICDSLFPNKKVDQ